MWLLRDALSWARRVRGVESLRGLHVEHVDAYADRRGVDSSRKGFEGGLNDFDLGLFAGFVGRVHAPGCYLVKLASLAQFDCTDAWSEAVGVFGGVHDGQQKSFTVARKCGQDVEGISWAAGGGWSPVDEICAGNFLLGRIAGDGDGTGVEKVSLDQLHDHCLSRKARGVTADIGQQT